MYCDFATSMFSTFVNGVYDKVEDLNKAILYQNKLTKNYELELT
jgi:hypothetical protein